MDMKRRLGIAIPLALFFQVILATPGYTTAPRYTLKDLGPFVPERINDKGQVVGFYLDIDGFPRAVLYENGTLIDLGTFGGNVSVPYGLNNLGQVVGYASTTEGFLHAFLWEDGVIVDLTPIEKYPTLANGKGTYASGINDKGQIVGTAFIDGVVSGPVLWDNGELIPLGTLGGKLGDAYRINNTGQITGWSELASMGYHAFLYTNGIMKDLGNTFGGTNSEAKSLNDLGQVVGYASTAGDNEVRAFLYTDGLMVDLTSFPTATGSSYAVDINNKGQVIVKSAYDSFLYDNSIMTDLTQLVYSEFGLIGFSATGINANGWIVGVAYGCRDQFGVLLTTDRRALARAADGNNDSVTACGIGAFELQAAADLVSAVLPSSRSVQVGVAATAFATVINSTQANAVDCTISPLTSLPASFAYQATDPAANQVRGSPNTPVDIAPGAAQSFVFALTPTAPFPPTDVQFSFACANTEPAPVNTGLTTLLLSASNTPVPDIVALATTTTNDGIVNITGTNGTGAFAVATVNVGAAGNITARADTGGAHIPVTLFICQTDPGTGDCLAPPASSVTALVNNSATPTFGIFVQGIGNVPFDPGLNRIFVRFKDGGGVTRGSTSVALRTQ
jgi:probable HAF family extracellular repeat protein